MIENMEWYGWAALVACLCKIYLLAYSRKYTWANITWYLLVAGFLFQNLSELFMYTYTEDVFSSLVWVKAYYISALIAGLSILNYLTRSKSWKLVMVNIVTISATICVLIFTDAMLIGIESIAPIVTVKGQHFSLLLVVAILCLGSIFFTLASNYLSSSKSPKRQCQHVYHALAFSPFILVGAYYCAGTLLGFELNASGLFPIATTLFMWFSFQMKCKDSYLTQRDPRSYLPGTREARLHAVANNNLFLFASRRAGLTTVLDDMEKSLIEYAVTQFSGNKSLIARELGISRHTLDRRLHKHDIQIT